MKNTLFLIILFSFALSGCIATSREIVDLKDEIYQLQIKLVDLQHNQADLSSKMDTVSSSMDALNSELQMSSSRMSLLGQRMDDIEANLSHRMDKLFEQMSGSKLSVAPSPSDLYQLAYSDFSSGKYDLAIVGFKSYIKKYPKGELAGQSKYYIGESHYSQSKWGRALKEFKSVEEDYPVTSLHASARLKRALCLELLGKVKEGRELMGLLIKDFPNSPESYTAKEKLESSKADGK